MTQAPKEPLCGSEYTDGLCGIDETPCDKVGCKKWLSLLNRCGLPHGNYASRPYPAPEHEDWARTMHVDQDSIDPPQPTIIPCSRPHPAPTDEQCRICSEATERQALGESQQRIDAVITALKVTTTDNDDIRKGIDCAIALLQAGDP
jgi:hypothetical protein